MSSAAEQEAVREGGLPSPAVGRRPVVNGRHRESGTPGTAVWPGTPTPLGARFRVGPDGVAGTNFALWAGGADAVDGAVEIGESRIPARYLFDSVLAL